MTRGLGTVYLKTRTRKDGGTREFYVAQIKITVNGKEKRIEGQGKTAALAIEARNQAIARALTGTTPLPAKAPIRSGSVAALITDWSRDRKVGAERTREHTDAVIKNHILPTIGEIPIRQLKDRDIKLMLDSRETQWTKVATYKALHAFLKDMETKGTIRKNPIITVDVPKEPRAKGSTSVDMDERVKRLKAMLAWMKRTQWMNEHPMYWARLMLALDGLRPGEARGLRWESIEGLRNKDGVIKIETQLGYQCEQLTLIPYAKNETKRKVVLRESTRDALIAWKKVQAGFKHRKNWKPREGMGDLVLTHENGTPLRQQEDSSEWRKLLLEAQKRYKKPVLWTMLYNRHIAVTLLRDAGVPAGVVSAMMGHTIVVEDAKYYQSQISAQQKAMTKIDKITAMKP
jgi:integrase